ncbi:MAG: hypothetical protein KDE27_23960 [Planctomycetes bacterium]|nr:hypothetical protein [Planctomycetota bacterium]
MLKSVLLSSALAILTATAPAQCGALTATGTGAPGTTVDLTLTGSTPNALAILVVGDTLGTTSIATPFATLVLGLESPFLPVPIGLTDGNGDASLTIDVPSAVTQGADLFGQGVAIDFSFGPTGPSIAFCVSDTAAFHLGT